MLGRRSEDIGRYVAKQLLSDCQSGVTVDQFFADQIIHIAALLHRNQAILISRMTNYVQVTISLGHIFCGVFFFRKELIFKL
ncbi:MAG: RNA 3'-terminal phosphate cyclase [Nitrospirota bacterium]|nr:RNA 3'-terminal phosphate cyclase [Nitrospirota bacterium]